MTDIRLDPAPPVGTPVAGPLAVPTKRRHLIHYVTLPTLFAILVDVVTKHLAVMYLVKDQLTRVGPLTLQLVYNAGSTPDPHHSPISHVALTHLVTLAFVLALWALLKTKPAAIGVGLAIGGMLGNFLSLWLAPHRVADFIPVGVGICNLADIFVALGALIIAASATNAVRRLYRNYTASH